MNATAPTSHPPLATVIARYASSRYYAQCLGILTAFLRPKLLTAEQFGLWSLLTVIPAYASYAHLGTQSSLRYLIPLYRARQAGEELADVKNTTFVISLAGNLLIAFALVLFSFKSGLKVPYRAGLWTMALVVVLQGLRDYHVTLLKGTERFPVISTANYLETTCTLLLTVPLLFFFKIYGLYATLILTFSVLLAYYGRQQALQVRVRLRGRVTRELIARGFPIMISGLAITLLATADRMAISYFLDTAAVGYYGIAAMISGFMMQLPGFAREVLEPQMMKSVAQHKPEVVVDEYLVRPLVNTAYLVPFLIGPVFLVLPAAIPLVLPRYLPSIVPTQILVLGVYFAALSHGPRMFVVARDWQWPAALLLLPVVAANIAMDIVFIKCGYGLAGVAAASSTAYLLLFGTLFFFLARRLPSRSPAWKRHVPAMLLPFPVMCATLAVLQVGMPRILANPYLAAAANILVFLGVMAGAYRLARRKLPLLTGFGV